MEVGQHSLVADSSPDAVPDLHNGPLAIQRFETMSTSGILQYKAFNRSSFTFSLYHPSKPLIVRVLNIEHLEAHTGVECIQRLIIPSVNILHLSLWGADTSVYSRVIEQSSGLPRLHTLTLCEQDEPVDIGIC